MDYSCLDSLEPEIRCEILSVVHRLAYLQMSNGALSVAEMQAAGFELQPDHKDLALTLFGEWLVESAHAAVERNKELAILDTAKAMSLTGEGERILREIANS